MSGAFLVALAMLSAAASAPARKPRPPARPPDNTITAWLPLEYVPLAVDASFDVASLPAAEQPRASALADLVLRDAPVSEVDTAAAELLFSRHRRNAAAWRLLRAVHLRAAGQARAARRLPAAAEHLRRVAAVAPEAAVEIDLVMVLLEQGRWADAEREGRSLWSHRSEDAAGPLAVAFALLRQDRAAEAHEAAQAAREVEDSERVRRMLALIQGQLASEQGMSEARHWHFHVLYEGAPNLELGRAVADRLESHYADLASLFEYEPTSTIPVILFTKERYHAVTGTGHWSGGAYSAQDGRIRIPAGGLSAAALGEIDSTLRHELVHVFVDERTGGAAPRFLHEGLAQYVEGERVTSLLNMDTLAALADGRLDGVGGFYAEALSFGEYLVQLAGQRGVNDLLEAIGEARDADAGFRKVYGVDYKKIRADWREWAVVQYR